MRGTPARWPTSRSCGRARQKLARLRARPQGLPRYRSVLYRRIPKLFADLALARGDGRYARIQRALGGVQLLILDDWGLEPLDAAARHDLLEILEERYGRRSTLITSQIPVEKWHELIGDPTYTDAIPDRIVHNAHRINLTGHSLRRSRASKPSIDRPHHRMQKLISQ
jgi:DNA replication protein DnaC